MRRTYFVFAALLPLLATGCLVDMLASTAIQGELQKEQLGVLTRQLEAAKEFKSDTEVNQAVQAYTAEHGAYPASLEALVPDYFTAVPTQADGTPYSYDPATGKIGAAQPMLAAPAASGASNSERIAQIRGAINKYGTAVGYYPPSLQALVPQYLPSVPKAVNGQDFIYYPENGALLEPQGASPTQPMPAGGYAQTPAMRRPAGGAGVGPMGEAMTGIGIQSELNSMSNAGSSAAGSRMRGDARGIGQDQTQRQEQAMDNLGL